MYESREKKERKGRDHQQRKKNELNTMFYKSTRRRGSTLVLSFPFGRCITGTHTHIGTYFFSSFSLKSFSIKRI